MKSPLPETTSLGSRVSWGALAFAVACLGFCAWYIPVDRRAYLAIYMDFHLKLPASTQIALDIPEMAFWAVALLSVGAMAGVQWVARVKSDAAMFHMLVALLCCVAFAAYRQAMTEPVVSLLHAIR